MSRFFRQIILPEFGDEGQEKLSGARVLVVGAGGLGCPALLYLAAAGVGTLGIVDGDSVGASNLNRQTLFGPKDIGAPKAEKAAEVLKAQYPDVSFQVYNTFLDNKNALEILDAFDLILDGSDNFPTRYLVNDACVLLEKPLIMGAVYQYEGQVAVFNTGKQPVNYRDLYPTPPEAHEIPNCSETGVLGVLPGLIGNLQATEAIKLISGLGNPLNNKVLFYNMKTAGFFEVAVPPAPDKTGLPKTKAEFKASNYNISCGMAQEISWQKAMDWYHSINESMLIDIREPEEEPAVNHPSVTKIPMGILQRDPKRIQAAEHVLLFCRSGQRSKKLASILKEIYPEKKIFSVEGGILHPSSILNQQP